jgi:integrase
MSVRKRKWTTSLGEPREAWVVDYADQEGDRVLKTFEKKKEADAFHATVKVEVGQGTHITPHKSETVSEVAERWIKRVEADGRERATVRQYRQHVNLHIAPRIGAIKLANLTPKQVETFRDELLAGNKERGWRALSRPLARKVMTSFKSILKTAKRAHLADDVKIGGNKRNERKLEMGVDIPTPDEVKLLLKAAAGAQHVRTRALLATAIFTGLRASELRGLRWKDADLKTGGLHVRQRADRWCEIGPPKSKSSERDIDFGPLLLNALKEWKLACPKGEKGLVFPTASGEVEHHKNMLRGLVPIMKAAGLTDKAGEPKYGLHSLRHYFASWCINRKTDGGRELPPKNVQTLLGHNSIMMTLDIYGHLFKSGNDRAELAEAEKALWA